MRNLSHLLLYLLLALVAGGCGRVGDPATDVDPAPGDEVPGWEISSWRPEVLDPGLPQTIIEGARIIISLPNIVPYTVVGVHIDDGKVAVQTDLPDMPGRSLTSHDPAGHENVTVIDIITPSSRALEQVVVLGETGRSVDIRVGLGQAVQLANHFADANFGTLPPWWSLEFIESGDEIRPVYIIDFSDAQTINRTGTSAVAGLFLVDAVSGEVTSPGMSVVPLGNTRLFAGDASFLGWTADNHLLLLAGDMLSLRAPSGDIVWEVEPPLPAAHLAYCGAVDSHAYIQFEDGPSYSISLTDGSHDRADVPSLPPDRYWMNVIREDVYSAGEIIGQRMILSAPVAGFEVRLEGYEDRATERSTLDAVILDGESRWDVPGDVFRDYTDFRFSYPCDAAGALYFSTEIYGPRYGVWVTEYALWELVPSTRDLRHVSYMPVPEVRLSPDGGYAVYQLGSWVDDRWRGKVFLISIAGD